MKKAGRPWNPDRNWIDGDIAYLTLTKGYTAVIDAADFDKVGHMPWFANTGHNAHLVYARGNRNTPEGQITLHLHRYLLDAPDDKLVDHIDGNPLNNRRSNLRLTDHVGNARNRRMRRTNKAGLKGVKKCPYTGRYGARIFFRKKTIWLGTFDTAAQAHEAYKQAATGLFGEFSRFA